MKDLTVEQVVAVHTRIMADLGGDCRVLSEANIHQMVFRANLIPDCIPRAAFIFYSLSAYPAFRGGNAGTALALAEEVLASGECRITGVRAEIMALADGVLAFTTEPEEIEQWLSLNVEGSASRNQPV